MARSLTITPIRVKQEDCLMLAFNGSFVNKEIGKVQKLIELIEKGEFEKVKLDFANLDDINGTCVEALIELSEKSKAAKKSLYIGDVKAGIYDILKKYKAFEHMPHAGDRLGILKQVTPNIKITLPSNMDEVTAEKLLDQLFSQTKQATLKTLQGAKGTGKESVHTSATIEDEKMVVKVTQKPSGKTRTSKIDYK